MEAVLLPLLIVSINPNAPVEARYPEASEVFHCTFEEPWDENFDGWPDGWTRRKGSGFPSYVSIKISAEQSPEGQRCLRMDMDGGGALVYSPAITVGPLFAYVLEAYLKIEGFKHNRAFLSLSLLSEDRNTKQRRRLETFYSEQFQTTDGWQKIRLGPITPSSDEVRLAIVGLHVQPGDREDLTGSALFDDLWLGRLPRMSLDTSNPYNFFTDPKDVEIRCQVSGFLDERPEVTFRLENIVGDELATIKRELSTRPAATETELSLDSFSEEPVGMIGTTKWTDAISTPGFYRVRATMKGRAKLVHRRELNLVVLEPRRAVSGGVFGWTLPRGGKPLPLPTLGQVLPQVGINWLKYPLWYEDQGNEAFVAQLSGFVERLSARGIELVGLLHKPPQSLRELYGARDSISAAELFAPDPKVWYPSLEPVMTRLATRVRCWQLGDDTDTSFVDYPNLPGKIGQVKTELDRIGQDVSLGLGWGWVNALPRATKKNQPWQFLALSADPPLTHQEVGAYLDACQGAGIERWIAVQPLAKDEYSVETRAVDLVRRMMAARIHGAEAVFCPDPISTQRGLINDDGTPGELLMPWRTAALALGAKEYLGSIQLPEGSTNQVFAAGEEAVMVVWNDRPTDEVLYLGDDVRQIDLWGNSTTPAKQEHRQVIKVTRLPSFVTGLSAPVASWRMGFSLATDRIPSVFGRAHQNSFRLKNTFAGGAGGTATLVTPEVWKVEPRQANFRLAGDEQLTHHFEVTLPYNANSGHHKIRADFEVQADRSYRFSVYRHLDVGLGDVYIEVSTRRNDRGELEVEQRFTNETKDRVSFQCRLYIPDRRTLKCQVLDLGAGTDVKIYRLTRGEELVGKSLWLKADEIGDRARMLNYRFVAKP